MVRVDFLFTIITFAVSFLIVGGALGLALRERSRWSDLSPGAPGTRGRGVQWLTGTTDPLPAQGDRGDFFANTHTGDLFTKRTQVLWERVGRVGGQGGPQGPRGHAGGPGTTEGTKWFDAAGVPFPARVDGASVMTYGSASTASASTQPLTMTAILGKGGFVVPKGLPTKVVLVPDMTSSPASWPAPFDGPSATLPIIQIRGARDGSRAVALLSDGTLHRTLGSGVTDGWQEITPNIPGSTGTLAFVATALDTEAIWCYIPAFISGSDAILASFDGGETWEAPGSPMAAVAGIPGTTDRVSLFEASPDGGALYTVLRSDSSLYRSELPTVGTYNWQEVVGGNNAGDYTNLAVVGVGRTGSFLMLSSSVAASGPVLSWYSGDDDTWDHGLPLPIVASSSAANWVIAGLAPHFFIYDGDAGLYFTTWPTPPGGRPSYTSSVHPGDFALDTTTKDYYFFDGLAWVTQGGRNMTGSAGDVGVVGENNERWYHGTTAPASSLGAEGDFYLDTATGDVYEKKAAGWENKGDPGVARGPATQGDPGEEGEVWLRGTTEPKEDPAAQNAPAGDLYFDTSRGTMWERTSVVSSGNYGWEEIGRQTNLWFHGTTAPSSSTGSDGDYYINTSDGKVWRHTGGAWVLAFEGLKGPTGDPEPGEPGSPGPTGPTGVQGPFGRSGSFSVPYMEETDGKPYWSTPSKVSFEGDSVLIPMNTEGTTGGGTSVVVKDPFPATGVAADSTENYPGDRTTGLGDGWSASQISGLSRLVAVTNIKPNVDYGVRADTGSRLDRRAMLGETTASLSAMYNGVRHVGGVSSTGLSNPTYRAPLYTLGKSALPARKTLWTKGYGGATLASATPSTFKTAIATPISASRGTDASTATNTTVGLGHNRFWGSMPSGLAMGVNGRLRVTYTWAQPTTGSGPGRDGSVAAISFIMTPQGPPSDDPYATPTPIYLPIHNGTGTAYGNFRLPARLGASYHPQYCLEVQGVVAFTAAGTWLEVAPFSGLNTGTASDGILEVHSLLVDVWRDAEVA